MIYRVIGLVCGSTKEGVDIVFTELHENGGKWNYEIVKVSSNPYPPNWMEKLEYAVDLNAREYSLLHTGFGEYLGTLVNDFIDQNDLHFKVALISVKGYSTFHDPLQQLAAEIGHGAVIAALAKLPVVTDIMAIDTALGGKGKGWTAIAEKLLNNQAGPLHSAPGETVTSDATEYELSGHKQALCIALMGVLRWREEVNVLSAASGASSDSVGGAMWMGHEN